MDFISEIGFDAPKGKSREMQEWLRANEPKLRAEAPKGWEYIGTYAAVISTQREAGEFRQLWRHTSYADMDTWAATMREPTAFGQLFDEFSTKFIDDAREARWSQTIMKAVTDASIWGES
ncbi:MAG TPA: hypothetical protein VJN50_10325 [Actinomycetota bacterium]|nr:hypothetical protein [Actinomycetota bacterium]